MEYRGPLEQGLGLQEELDRGYLAKCSNCHKICRVYEDFSVFCERCGHEWTISISSATMLLFVCFDDRDERIEVYETSSKVKAKNMWKSKYYFREWAGPVNCMQVTEEQVKKIRETGDPWVKYR
jgi:hypothetical protein